MAATRQSSGSAPDTGGLDQAGIERLSIDTIRGLAMDAVQKANSGHPGTAMALAPLAYTIFKRFLRANPRDPAWPDRDRFVLSSGHACVLQYSLLHLVGYDLGLEDLAAVPPVGLAHARAPRARSHAGHRGHDRAARPGRRQRGRDGDGRAVPRRALQPARPRAGRPPRLRDLLRRRHDGGDQPGGGLDRRPLRARQADRLLRRQPHHDRRHDLDLLRRREPRRADGGRRLARPAGRGLRGHRGAGGGADGGARGSRAPVVHRDPLPHRLSGAERPRHGQVARRAARRGGGAPGQGGDGLRSRAQLLGRRARLRAHVDRRAGWQRPGAVERALPAVAGGLPGDGRGLGPGVVGTAARRLARGAAELRGRREARHPRGRSEGDGRLRRASRRR